MRIKKAYAIVRKTRRREGICVDGTSNVIQKKMKTAHKYFFITLRVLNPQLYLATKCHRKMKVEDVDVSNSLNK